MDDKKIDHINVQNVELILLIDFYLLNSTFQIILRVMVEKITKNNFFDYSLFK